MNLQHNVLGWKSSIRWSKVDEPTCGLKQTQRCCGSSRLAITSGRTIGQPARLSQEEWDEHFSNTCDKITAHVCFSRSEFTGLTATKMTRGDELPRHLILETEWLRFLSSCGGGVDGDSGQFRGHNHLRGGRKRHTKAFVPQNCSFESTSAVRNPERVSEQRQKQSVGGVFLAIVTKTHASLNDPSPTPQTSSIYTSLYVAAVLQREVTLGDRQVSVHAE